MFPYKNRARIYGFEEYNIVSLYSWIFVNTWSTYFPYNFDNSPGNYIITKDLPFKLSKTYMNKWWDSVSFEPELCENHSELLSTAKKVYTHPSCKLSRSMMAEKYKKSLNPYLSDAVIMPKPAYNELVLNDFAVFINETYGIIVKIEIDSTSEDILAKVKTFQEGDSLRKHVTTNFNSVSTDMIDCNKALDATLMYVGPLLYVPNTCSYVMDILTNALPADKIVFEDSVQESLSSEANKLDFDSLTSIMDMLNSSDGNTVSAGLKALSMMDWMHYPNSVRYILNKVDNKWNWAYNKACNSTSVKYMLNTISNNRNRRGWPGNYDHEIYAEDYELFKQLWMHYNKVSSENLLEDLRFMDFMTVDQGMIVPCIKERAA